MISWYNISVHKNKKPSCKRANCQNTYIDLSTIIAQGLTKMNYPRRMGRGLSERIKSWKII